MEYPEVQLSRWINLPYNVIITFPRGFSSRAVLGNIIESLSNSILITDDYVEGITANIRGRKRTYTFKELPNKISSNTPVIVFSNNFDPQDLEMFDKNKFIFVLEYGFTTEFLEELENIYKPFIYGTFISKSSFNIMTLKIISVEIPDFTQEYDDIDEKTAAALCNFNYRPEWEEKEDQPVDKGGWMSTELLDEIYKRGPKLKIIYNLINENNVKNIVIFTLFSSEYGAYLVANTLRLQKVDILLTTDNGSESSREKIYRKFNENKEGRKILVTNVIPEILLKEVNIIIFFDSSPIDTRRELLSKCRDTSISLIATEADIEDLETEDAIANEVFLEYQEDSKEAYNELFKISSRISLLSSGKALVQQRSSPR
jgi:hypothetical protein